MSTLVVIPCLNEAPHLPRLLDLLLTDPRADLVVVADGGSNDGSRAIVEEAAKTNARVVLLDNPQRLQSAGINAAVAEYGAKYEWLVRVDAHSFYPDNFISLLLDAAQRTNARSVVVPMITRSQGCFQRAVASAQNSVIGTGAAAHRHPSSDGKFVDHGHHALMAIDDFRRAGGYCEAMHCNEDAELDHRLRKNNVAIWLEPSAMIGYLPRSTPGALWRQYLRYGQGRARNLRRHGEGLRLRHVLPLAVPLALLLACFALIHPVFLVPALLWAGSMLFLGALLGIRIGNVCAMGSGVPAMIMHTAWAFGFMQEFITKPGGVPAQFGFDTGSGEKA